MNLLKEALEDSREILRLRGDCKDHCRLVKDLLVLKELDAAKEALSKAQAIYTESSALKDLAGELTVAEEVHKRSRKSLEDYESRELATKEKELLSQLDQSWVKVRRQWAQRSDPCTHMHMENYGAESEGLQGVKFHCSRCNKEIKEPAKVAQEKEIMQHLGNQDNSIPEDSAMRGLTIGFVLLLCEKFDLWKWTTRDVLYKFVVPLTSEKRCRFVDLPMFKLSGAEVVGLADTFISHCNMAPFGAMVAGVSDGGVNLQRKIWIDIFAVRQWPSTKHDLHFETVIGKCKSCVVICPSLPLVHCGVRDLSNLHEDIKKQIPFFRAWCIYEVFYAAHYEKVLVVKGGSHHQIRDNREFVFIPNPGMLTKMSQAMHIDTAETSNPSDSKMIFQKIEGYRRYGGGVDGLNKKVKDVILSAYDTVRYPVLHSAACGDTASMAVLRESPEMYLENVIRGGYISLLKDIIANNRELLEWREPAGGLTPLMIAARAGNLPCVDYLKSLGANIYAKDSVGFTALKHAHDFGYVDVEECLTNAATIIDTTHTVSRDTTRTVSTHTVSRDTTHTVSRNNGHKFSFYLPFFKKKGNK
eukprot:gene30276-39496_t